MARTTNDPELVKGFAKRINEELDRIDFPRNGRGAELAARTNVTHTTSNAWLRGVMPAISKIIEICDTLKLDFTYLCTGKRTAISSVSPINPEVFRAAVAAVNGYVTSEGIQNEVGMERLGALYLRAYNVLISKGDEEKIKEDIDLAAGR